MQKFLTDDRAEYYTLLSALADLLLQQGIAVAGSVNQYGEVQSESLPATRNLRDRPSAR